MMNVASQVRDVACDGQKLVEVNLGAWSLPSDCTEVTWHVDAAKFGPSDLGPADQQTLVMDGWWLLSGPSSILRLAPDNKEFLRIRLNSSNSTQKVSLLPPLSAPPGYFLMGNPPEHNINVGEVSLSYVIEDLSAVTAFVEPERHAAALQYFGSVLNSTDERQAPKLRVVWFGVHKDKHELSGAAGYDTLLANYVIPEQNPDPEYFYRPFVLVLHEQFHQFQKTDHSAGPRPEWLGESLAQYYALKASLKSFPSNDALTAIYRQETDLDAEITIGLLEVQRQIDTDKNYERYSLFYSQGVRFWAEVDRMLNEVGSGNTDLDDVLPGIFQISFRYGHKIPPEFRELLSAIGEEKLNAVIKKYLIGPNDQ